MQQHTQPHPAAASEGRVSATAKALKILDCFTPSQPDLTEGYAALLGRACNSLSAYAHLFPVIPLKPNL